MFDGGGSVSETSVLCSRRGRPCWPIEAVNRRAERAEALCSILTDSAGIWLNFKFRAAQLHEAAERQIKKEK